jgi:hypothetical protein
MEKNMREDEKGWKEAVIAWSVCASIHRNYAKGRDPFYTTRQSDFVKALTGENNEYQLPYAPACS